MRSGIWVGILTASVAMILITTNLPVGAYGPGVANGFVGHPNGDTWWTGTWSAVYVHPDTVNDPWTTGVTFNDLSYRHLNWGDNVYNKYVKEVTIPWIGIKYVGDNFMTLYPHDDLGGSMNNRLLLTGPLDNNNNFNGYAESNNQPANPTILVGVFDLDLNNNGVLDFQFEETIQLFGNGGPGGHGYVLAGIKVLQAPQGWAVVINGQQKQIDRIRYSFLMDCDVYDTSLNTFYLWNNGLNRWEQHNNECAGVADLCDGSGRCARFYNQAANRQIAAEVLPDGHIWAHWHAQRYHGNEYSQWPENYELPNLENLVNQDGQLWCDEEYDVAHGNFPPVGNPAGFTFSDFNV
jgi:hypothetical protein